jgi:hypothetical protein
MPCHKVERIKQTPLVVAHSYENPSNSLSVNSGMSSGETGDFSFWLNVDSPELLELQDYTCQKIGISFN